MTNDELNTLLQTLLDNAVNEFEGLGIKVRFNSAAPHTSEHDGRYADPDRASRPYQEQSQWHNPSLWGPQGRPPSFPVKKDGE